MTSRPGARPARALEHWLVLYRRTWRGSVVSSLVSPLLFLTALGVGLGSLVDARAGTGGTAAGLGGERYLDFLAPGLLAASAMQTAIGESTWPVMSAIRWSRTYDAMLATPLRVTDVLAGHLGFIAVRLTITATAFLAIGAVLGVWSSPLALLALPAAVLTGLAFAAPAMAFAATIERDTGFVLLYRVGVFPLFLFSGVFFPLRQLPEGLQLLARGTPLYHGAALCRALAAGRPGLATVGSVAVLAGWTALGVVLAARAYRRRLVS